MGNPGRFFLLCLLCSYLQSISSPAERIRWKSLHFAPPAYVNFDKAGYEIKGYRLRGGASRSLLPSALGPMVMALQNTPGSILGAALTLPAAQHLTVSPCRAGSSSFPACTYDLLQTLFLLQKSVKFMVAWANYLLLSPAFPSSSAWSCRNWSFILHLKNYICHYSCQGKVRKVRKRSRKERHL